MSIEDDIAVDPVLGEEEEEILCSLSAELERNYQQLELDALHAAGELERNYQQLELDALHAAGELEGNYQQLELGNYQQLELDALYGAGELERNYQQLELDALHGAGELLRRETNSLKFSQYKSRNFSVSRPEATKHGFSFLIQ